MKLLNTILVALATMSLCSAGVLAEKKDNAEKDAAAVSKAQTDKAPELSPSIARQLELKRKLLAASKDQTLAQMVDHNRKSWERLTPDQKDQFRQYAKAFLDKSPEEQAKLLRRYEKLIRMTAEKREAYRRRAVWLKEVVSTLTDQQKQALQEMTPQQRAEELIRLRDKLIEEGKLTLPEQRQPAERHDH
ncbi:MAG: DUF3106 domain-containing protein [Phycisphaerae bacterium]